LPGITCGRGVGFYCEGLIKYIINLSNRLVNIHVLTNQGFWGFGVLGFWGSCLNYQATPLYVGPLPQKSKAIQVEETFLACF
jgi:hypothetical protein